MKRNETEIHKWNLADTITALRMAAVLFLLPLPTNSLAFFLVYTLAGITDALDGWIARKTGKESDFGARLDSVADLLFYGVLLLRLFPVLWQVLPGTIWYAVAGIILVRLLSYTAAAVKYHRFASLHTWLNKLTGGAVFLLPYVLAVSTGTVYCWALCVLAFASSLEELTIHLCCPHYRGDRKSIFGGNGGETVDTVVEGVEQDMEAWMALVEQVRWGFPGLETEAALEEHRNTVLKFMRRKGAICVKGEQGIKGVLLFSRKHNMICCLAVSAAYRKQGIGSKLLSYALDQLDRTRPITVSTFREEDEKGTAPRALYQKFGFQPEALIEEFGYPNQRFVLHPRTE